MLPTITPPVAISMHSFLATYTCSGMFLAHFTRWTGCTLEYTYVHTTSTLEGTYVRRTCSLPLTCTERAGQLKAGSATPLVALLLCRSSSVQSVDIWVARSVYSGKPGDEAVITSLDLDISFYLLVLSLSFVPWSLGTRLFSGYSLGTKLRARHCDLLCSLYTHRN